MIATSTKMTLNEHRCRDLEEATDEDVQVYRDAQYPQTRTARCFYDCMYQYYGISDGRRFCRETFLNRVLDRSQLEQAQQYVRKAADRCERLEHGDRCELAADIHNCINDEEYLV
ncbi:hypothetical protein quinque_012654 [Culex quinquefasciatus]